MSAANIPGQLVVRSWIDHSVTTVGYIGEKGRFIALADCSIGPDFAVTYEPFARLLAAAPELLEALRELSDDIADRFDMGSPSTNPGMKNAVATARAAIAKATGSTT